MTTLIAIAYPDRDAAERARRELAAAGREELLQLDDAVVVVRETDGAVKLHQSMSAVGAGVTVGAAGGAMIGLLFLAPLFGMAIGAAGGALGGKLSDIGINDDFVKHLGATLQPGGAALLALGQSDARDKIIDRMRPFGGEIIQTSLSSEEEEQLRAAFSGPDQARARPPYAASP